MLQKLFFDKHDRELLHMINTIIDHGATHELEHRLFNANLHPHGMLELATTHEYRMAHAVMNLLGSLEAGQAEDRLLALRILRDEVLHSARTPFRYNTGRVLIQIMKQIIRSRNDTSYQLQLVHDFKTVAGGNPRLVRKALAQYHLLEMPEAWNQLTLDHHVHDANTKGRKNPTHLIMDAWVKGIRFLTVVYYNYVEPNAAKELFQAAAIMGISVRIGIEYLSPFRGQYVSFIWVPKGFSDAESFLSFLAEHPTQALMQEGRKASLWLQEHVLATLDRWNTVHLPALAAQLGIPLSPLDPNHFLSFVGSGQTSFLHLAEYAHKMMLDALKQAATALQQERCTATAEQAAALDARLQYLDQLTPDSIMETWIKPDCNPDLPSPDLPAQQDNAPDLLHMPPHLLLDWLSSLRSSSCITLQLTRLTPEDVLELLWDCQGMITHLELFNLKEWQEHNLEHINAINDLQLAINKGSLLHLKQMLRFMIHKLERSENPDDAERCEKFNIILRNIPHLQSPYKFKELGSRIGTDSTSHSGMRYGMGLAVAETLPPSARKSLAQAKRFSPVVLPVRLTLAYRETYQLPDKTTWYTGKLAASMRRLWGLRTFGLRKQSEWRASSALTRISKTGNVITMGGVGGEGRNGFYQPPTPTTPRRWLGFSRLNTPLSNTLKVLAGFIPAMLTFLHTQEWWVLAWFGAVVWFTITGLRNIAQAVLAGGGIGKDSLLHWNNHVNWTRICDSLMYTGLSVVLLEWIVRSLLLEHVLNISTVDHPVQAFSIIALTNSLYIASHNLYRGLPKEAIIGNLFRNILAIPVSLVYNEVLLLGLPLVLESNPLALLQQGAAIISKAASDTVAGVIEGFADRRNNLRLRLWDYETKLRHFFECYAKLELAFPDKDILSLLSRPVDFIHMTSTEAKDLQIISIINALDFMYFWFYQPCAQQTLLALIRGMTREERVILARSQGVLLSVREVSQLFVDGLLGNNFARALSFYLDRHEQYIHAINEHCATVSMNKRAA